MIPPRLPEPRVIRFASKSGRAPEEQADSPRGGAWLPWRRPTSPPEAPLPPPPEAAPPAVPPPAAPPESPAEPPPSLAPRLMPARPPLIRPAEPPPPALPPAAPKIRAPALRPASQAPLPEAPRLAPAEAPTLPPSPAAETRPAPPRHAVARRHGRGRLGLIILGVTLLGLGGWLALAPVDGVVVAPGRIIVESPGLDVRHPDGGQVVRLLVREGDRVAAGDVLAALDPLRLQGQASLARGQLDGVRLLVARLRAEQGSQLALTLPEDLMERARREPALAAAIQAQRSAMDARRLAFEGEVAVLNQRIRQLREQIGGLVVLDQARQQQSRVFRQELDGVLELLRGGHATRTRAMALEREIARLEGERGDHASQVSRLEQAIGEVELRILQLHRNLDEELATRLREGEQELADAQERLAAIEEQARRLEIRAPVAGRVEELAVQAEGALILPGQALLRIMPGEARLLVEAELGAEDLERLRPAAEAMIRLPPGDMPRVAGRLLEITPMPADPQDGRPRFRARITLGAQSHARLAEQGVVPGLPVQVALPAIGRSRLSDLLPALGLGPAREPPER